MRKLICLLILPLIAVFYFVGCGEDVSFTDVKELYEKMVNENGEIFFTDQDNPNTIVIKYTDAIESAIKKDEKPTQKIHQRYVAIAQQQDILECIFNYYENHHSNFYKEISSKEISVSESNDLYRRLEDLNASLNEFKDSYNNFIESTNNGVSEVMTFSMINYSYEVNTIIDKSFNFMNKFIELNTKYCIEKYEVNSLQNIKLRIDKAYVDLAYVDFLENFKGFNFSVADGKGVCDLSDMVISDEVYDWENGYINMKPIAQDIIDNMTSTDVYYEEVQSIFEEFVYNQKLFEQRINVYLTNYNSLNMYEINQYRYGIKQDLTYDRYVNSLTEDTRTKLKSNEDFIVNICNNNYIAMLNEICN